MIRRTEHLYAGFQEYATYHFALRTTGMVMLDDRLGHQKTLGANGRRHEFYKFRNWLAVSRYQNQTCELTLRYKLSWTRTLPVSAQYERAASQLPPGFLEINFQAGAIDLRSYIDGGPEWTAENVRALEISPNQKIAVVSDTGQIFRPVSEPPQRQETEERRASGFSRPASGSAQGVFRIVKPDENGSGVDTTPQYPTQAEAASDTSEQRNPQAETSPDTSEQRNPQAEAASEQGNPRQVERESEQARSERNQSREDLEQMRTALNQARRELERTRTERDQAREQFAQEQRRNESLQTSLSGSLEQLTERLEPDLEHLNAALQEKTRTIETRRAALETLSRETEALDSDLKSLETQTQELRRLKEIRCMDCQQAREELAALRTQYQDDEDSLRLLLEEESPLLRNSTLKETMNQIGTELDAVERRIGQIIRWRESVNGAVQKVILNGSGFLDANSELKG